MKMQDGKALWFGVEKLCVIYQFIFLNVKS